MLLYLLIVLVALVPGCRGDGESELPQPNDETWEKIRLVHAHWYVDAVKALIDAVGRNLTKESPASDYGQFRTCVQGLTDDLQARAKCLVRLYDQIRPVESAEEVGESRDEKSDDIQWIGGFAQSLSDETSVVNSATTRDEEILTTTASMTSADATTTAEMASKSAERSTKEDSASESVSEETSTTTTESTTLSARRIGGFVQEIDDSFESDSSASQESSEDSSATTTAPISGNTDSATAVSRRRPIVEWLFGPSKRRRPLPVRRRLRTERRRRLRFGRRRQRRAAAAVRAMERAPALQLARPVMRRPSLGHVFRSLLRSARPTTTASGGGGADWRSDMDELERLLKLQRLSAAEAKQRDAFMRHVLRHQADKPPATSRSHALAASETRLALLAERSPSQAEVFMGDLATFIELLSSINGTSSIRLLSPKFLPLLPDGDNEVALLSPHLFGMYGAEGNGSGVLPLAKLLGQLPTGERDAWMDFIMEASGSTERVQSLLHKLKGETGDPDERLVAANIRMHDVWQRVNRSYSAEQRRRLRDDGFVFLERDQLHTLYGDEGLYDAALLNFTLDDYGRTSDVERLLALETTFRKMAAGDEAEADAWQRRLKQVTLSPFAFAPAILAPAVLGPITLSPFIFSPVILSPVVLSPITLSPGVGNPLILSPYVLGPTILSPQVMTPFILSPYVLSPNILNPYVLSPLILSPYVLSPDILSPAVLGGTILSPYVLSPAVLNPGVLNADVLSPSVLS